MENNKNNFIWLGALLGLSIIIGTLVIGGFLYKIKSLDSTLSVTGSAKTAVTSDNVKWVMQITRQAKASTIATNSALAGKDTDFVKKFLTDHGIPETAINTSTVNISEIYQQYQMPEKDYSITQTLTVNSEDVNKITEIAKNIQPILTQGIIFSTLSLEYFYSKLPDLRVSLLKDAMTDATNRASQIAGSGGKSVGNLRSASSGVVQVLSRGSNDISDYGNYDTSTIEKDVMVTVRAAFTLK